jgi:hypothetical protein
VPDVDDERALRRRSYTQSALGLAVAALCVAFAYGLISAVTFGVLAPIARQYFLLFTTLTSALALVLVWRREAGVHGGFIRTGWIALLLIFAIPTATFAGAAVGLRLLSA